MAKYTNHFASNASSDAFAVILVNLGTPSAPEPTPVRTFLRQFLSDTRVVEFPKWLFWIVLNGIILVFRPRKSAEAYREIWTQNGSPLMLNTLSQVEKLKKNLSAAGVANAQVRCAMRYGEPSFETVVSELGSLGIDRLLIVPMYPQYSGSTTGSVFDDVGNVARKLRRIPSIRFVNRYCTNPQYIDSLKTSVLEHWQRNGKAQKLFMSFHGIPKEYCDKGDPYDYECIQTAELLAQALGLASDEWVMCFQSRFGRQQWLQPYTEDVMVQLPTEGVNTIDVICPGFSVDCLETLEEVNIGYRKLFMESGGQSFRYIPCLNDHPAHIRMLEQMVLDSASDWIVS